MLRISLQSHSTICIFTRSHKKMWVSCKRDTKNVTNWIPYLWNYPNTDRSVSLLSCDSNSAVLKHSVFCGGGLHSHAIAKLHWLAATWAWCWCADHCFHFSKLNNPEINSENSWNFTKYLEIWQKVPVFLSIVYDTTNSWIFIILERKKIISLKTPKIPENSWISGEVETLLVCLHSPATAPLHGYC